MVKSGVKKNSTKAFDVPSISLTNDAEVPSLRDTSAYRVAASFKFFEDDSLKQNVENFVDAPLMSCTFRPLLAKAAETTESMVSLFD